MENNEFESKRGKTQSIDISPEVISPIKPKKKKHKPKNVRRVQPRRMNLNVYLKLLQRTKRVTIKIIVIKINSLLEHSMMF